MSAAFGNALADPSAAPERRVHVVQGEYQVSRAPDVVLTTILGSCVAACLCDPVAQVGGMNHFLLPDGAEGMKSDELRYGVHSMELLINGMLQSGARRDRLRVWLFGGARLFDRLTDVGSKNAEFAENFVRREDLDYAGGSLRGLRARRIQFWPTTGRVRQMSLAATSVPPVVAAPAKITLPASSDVELF